MQSTQRTQRLLHAEHVTANTQVCRARRQDGDHAVLTRAAQTDAHRAARMSSSSKQQQSREQKEQRRSEHAGRETYTQRPGGQCARCRRRARVIRRRVHGRPTRARARPADDTPRSMCFGVPPPPQTFARGGAGTRRSNARARATRRTGAHKCAAALGGAKPSRARAPVAPARAARCVSANVPASGASSRRTARCVARVQNKKERRCEHARRARGEK
jgi:hypothetical protein